METRVNKHLKNLKILCEENNLTETKAFKEWFRNSQVVDDNGQPLIVYHGTNQTFNHFDNNYSAQGVHWFSSDRSKIERGESGANSSKTILAVYLSCQRLAGWDLYDRLSLYEIEHMGYDGIKLDDDYIVFNPTRIKSVNNRGTFNPNTKDIYK